jgi:hypothetical protein
LVTPVQKNGDVVANAGLNTASYEQAFFRASPDGDGLTYAANSAFAGALATPNSINYLAGRDPDTGWDTAALEPPRGTELLESGSRIYNHFTHFSEDLSQAWFLFTADPQLDPAGVPGYLNLYRRDNTTDSYTALTTVRPPTTPPASGDGLIRYVPRLSGVSADGAVAVFSANDRLAAAASAATAANGLPIQQLYEKRDGMAPRVVSLLPGGAGAANQPSTVGGGTANQADAVSADGSVIYWTTGSGIADHPFPTKSGGAEGRIYARVNGAATVAVSETVSGADARWWMASPDGSAAWFTVGADLYRFDLDSETSTPIATGVLGVADANADLTRAYLVSTAVLDPGPNSRGESAVSGQANLYHYEQGEGFSFVSAKLGSEANWLYNFDDLNLRRSKVSPDARRIAFMAIGSPTGYDNTDALSGRSLREVFHHSSVSGELYCVSCPPSGERSAGVDAYVFDGIAGTESHKGVGAWISP